MYLMGIARMLIVYKVLNMKGKTGCASLHVDNAGRLVAVLVQSNYAWQNIFDLLCIIFL